MVQTSDDAAFSHGRWESFLSFRVAGWMHFSAFFLLPQSANATATPVGRPLRPFGPSVLRSFPLSPFSHPPMIMLPARSSTPLNYIFLSQNSRRGEIREER